MVQLKDNNSFFSACYFVGRSTMKKLMDAYRKDVCFVLAPRWAGRCSGLIKWLRHRGVYPDFSMSSLWYCLPTGIMCILVLSWPQDTCPSTRHQTMFFAEKEGSVRLIGLREFDLKPFCVHSGKAILPMALLPPCHWAELPPMGQFKERWVSVAQVAIQDTCEWLLFSDLLQSMWQKGNHTLHWN